MDYQVVSSKNIYEFKSDIKKLMYEGYKLQGGVCVCVEGQNEYGFPIKSYHQAMVKFD